MMRSSLLLALGSATASFALPTIEAAGGKFFTSDGDQFFIKGIAYQLTPNDPLIDTEQCTRDATLMRRLGANTIRVYHVDPNADHSGCMAAFSDAGIYAMIDMDTFDTYILPNDPWWNQTQFDRYSEVMDAFHRYDNLLGLFVGNEIIAINNQSLSAPFIKASSRDLKAYRDSQGYRKIPIGYSATDIAELRPMLQDYLTCGGNASENVDFYGLNSYQWCDPTDYQTSGYSNLQTQAKDFPVPIFFSETGCNTPGPRLFNDQAAIFGPNMVNDWSGAIVYEWIEEANEYGLISYGPRADPTATGRNIEGGYTRAGTPTPVSPDFDNLSKHWATITPTGVARSDYDTNAVSTRACPTSTASGWLVNGNVALPSLGETLTNSYSSVPSATGAADSASPTESPNSVSGSAEIAGMAAGLVGVMMIFALWF
ncbi:glycoside hydrolase family 72 protein [Durotheca rogersii]|uniref:glycoside hydrolase family 72 protein n=1 Tax=Durotheca rogersii TaxID=419775 RepID=UPI00221F52D8|nr:glycoside hydrolase family 72 protein [Durotheca rogersii]KAI5863505.1 glycoside hydrolase family 72 protein [Durotheca rogersii]